MVPSSSAPARYRGGRKRRAGGEELHPLSVRFPERHYELYKELAVREGYHCTGDYIIAVMARAHADRNVRVPQYIEEARTAPEVPASLFDEFEGSGAMRRAS